MTNSTHEVELGKVEIACKNGAFNLSLRSGVYI